MCVFIDETESSVLTELFEVLKAKMANSTEAELVSMQSTLQSYKYDTNTDLQRNVFKKCVCLLHIVCYG